MDEQVVHTYGYSSDSDREPDFNSEDEARVSSTRALCGKLEFSHKDGNFDVYKGVARGCVTVKMGLTSIQAHIVPGNYYRFQNPYGIGCYCN